MKKPTLKAILDNATENMENYPPWLGGNDGWRKRISALEEALRLAHKALDTFDREVHLFETYYGKLNVTHDLAIARKAAKELLPPVEVVTP